MDNDFLVRDSVNALVIEDHPIAASFPLMDEKRLGELSNSIRDRGLIHPIILYEGKIIDGRNRHRACLMAGVEPRFAPFDGDNPWMRVWDWNAQRRDLTDDQRYLIWVQRILPGAKDYEEKKREIAEEANRKRSEAAKGNDNAFKWRDKQELQTLFDEDALSDLEEKYFYFNDKDIADIAFKGSDLTPSEYTQLLDNIREARRELRIPEQGGERGALYDAMVKGLKEESKGTPKENDDTVEWRAIYELQTLFQEGKLSEEEEQYYCYEDNIIAESDCKGEQFEKGLHDEDITSHQYVEALHRVRERRKELRIPAISSRGSLYAVLSDEFSEEDKVENSVPTTCGNTVLDGDAHNPSVALDAKESNTNSAGTSSSRTVCRPSEHPERRLVAESSNTNAGAAQRGKYLLKHAEPEIIDKVISGELPAARAIQQVKTTEYREKLETVAATLPESAEGTFDVLVIDPPWPLQKIERDVRPNQVAFDYPTMSEEEILAWSLPAEKAAEDCHLFLWTTHKFLPLAFRCLVAWDFRYTCTFVWHKPGGFQPIGSPQLNCEFCLYARRGSPQFVDVKAFNACFEAPRGAHSEKPEEFYELLRRVTAGRRLDMYNRRRIEGFIGWGKESGNGKV